MLVADCQEKTVRSVVEGLIYLSDLLQVYPFIWTIAISIKK